MQQTLSYNICVTKLSITWCLIMSSQFLLSISTPFFTSYHLNYISILVKIASVPWPGTINRFLTFLNFQSKKSQGKRFKNLWSSSFSHLRWGELRCMPAWHLYCSFHPRTTIIKLAELIKILRQLAAWCVLKGNLSRKLHSRSVWGVWHLPKAAERATGRVRVPHHVSLGLIQGCFHLFLLLHRQIQLFTVMNSRFGSLYLSLLSPYQCNS